MIQYFLKEIYLLYYYFKLKKLLRKYKFLKFRFYIKFNVNCFKFYSDSIFSKGNISIISLLLIKYQLLKFISYPKLIVK